MTIQEMLSFSSVAESQNGYTSVSIKQNVHVPVMKQAVIDALKVRDGGFYIDGTFGAGGHTRSILELGAVVLALDRDQDAVNRAAEFEKEYPNTFFIQRASFSNMDKIWGKKGAPMKVDGILLDLGFSSNQIENADRGFSFMKDGDLDMRFDISQELNAKSWLNNAVKDEMVRVFQEYGQEKNALLIANEIIRSRKANPISTTFDLVKIIEKYNEFDRKHAATRIFQAIRIHVNDEFTHIRKALVEAKKILKEHGRLAVLTFHSLEDKIVKDFFANEVSFLQLPTQSEVEENSRARSAKLRWMIKTEE